MSSLTHGALQQSLQEFCPGIRAQLGISKSVYFPQDQYRAKRTIAVFPEASVASVVGLPAHGITAAEVPVAVCSAMPTKDTHVPRQFFFLIPGDGSAIASDGVFASWAVVGMWDSATRTYVTDQATLLAQVDRCLPKKLPNQHPHHHHHPKPLPIGSFSPTVTTIIQPFAGAPVPPAAAWSPTAAAAATMTPMTPSGVPPTPRADDAVEVPIVMQAKNIWYDITGSEEVAEMRWEDFSQRIGNFPALLGDTSRVTVDGMHALFCSKPQDLKASRENFLKFVACFWRDWIGPGNIPSVDWAEASALLATRPRWFHCHLTWAKAANVLSSSPTPTFLVRYSDRLWKCGCFVYSRYNNATKRTVRIHTHALSDCVPPTDLSLPSKASHEAGIPQIGRCVHPAPRPD